MSTKIKTKVIVTGAGGNASVGFCKALLNSSNYYVIGTDLSILKIHFAQANKKFIVPPASSSKYIKALNQIVEKYQVDFIHCQSDKEVKFMAQYKTRLKTQTFLPDLEAIEIAQNKLKTHEKLNKKNVPVPLSFPINSISDIKKVFKHLKRPIWFRATSGAGGKGSLLISSPEIAKAWVEHWNGYGTFMASYYLPGKNLGWDSIWKNGKLIISHTKERISYAVSGSSPSGISGTSGVIKSVKRPNVDKICIDAILAIDPNPNGIYAVDLKEDKEGKPFITEINPGRFLSSSTHFFAETGFNLPDVFIQIALGHKVALKKLKYPLGLYLLRELDAQPLILSEKYIQKLEEKQKKQGFFNLK